jgi:glycosyltransferase involved in cell wall biosynthesis
MRVAIVLEATLGGIRKHVVDLVSGLHDSGYQVCFIYSLKRADAKFIKDLALLKQYGIDCIELPLKQGLGSPGNLYATFRLLSIFRKNKIQIVHVHGAVAGALGRLAAMLAPTVKKIIYAPHGGVLHKINAGARGRLYVFIEKLLTSKKLYFIAVSTDEKQRIQNLLNIPAEKIRLIPNGIDLSEPMVVYSPGEIEK